VRVGGTKIRSVFTKIYGNFHQPAPTLTRPEREVMEIAGRAGILPALRRKQYILKSCTLMSHWRSTVKSAILQLLFIDFTGEYY